LKTVNTKMIKVIEKRQNELTKLCSELIQAKSENPPGDTSEASGVAEDFLKQKASNIRLSSQRKGT